MLHVTKNIETVVNASHSTNQSLLSMVVLCAITTNILPVADLGWGGGEGRAPSQSQLFSFSCSFRQQFCKTRKHCSRMHTVHLETVCVSVSVTSTKLGGGVLCPKMNKFEQVSPLITTRCH